MDTLAEFSLKIFQSLHTYHDGCDARWYGAHEQGGVTATKHQQNDGGHQVPHVPSSVGDSGVSVEAASAAIIVPSRVHHHLLLLLLLVVRIRLLYVTYRQTSCTYIHTFIHTYIHANATEWSHGALLALPGYLCTKQALGACANKLLENGLGTRRRTSYLLTASGVGTRSPT